MNEIFTPEDDMLDAAEAEADAYEEYIKGQTCDGYEWRGDVPWKCKLPLGHRAPGGGFLGRSCQGTQTIVFDARQPDATTCPRCRVAVPLGRFCSCPMRWKG